MASPAGSADATGDTGAPGDVGGRRPSGLRHHWAVCPILVFLFSRALVFCTGYFATTLIGCRTGQSFHHLAPDNILLDIWTRWDGGWYMSIINDGYSWTPGQHCNVNFFPVYPLLARALASIIGRPVLAAVLVSNLSLLGALLYLYRLTELEFGRGSVAARATAYLACFPTAFFLSAVYSESTFLLFAVGAMYHARRNQWLRAGLMGALCSGTRLIGIVMWGVLLVEWLRANGFSTKSCRASAASLLQALRSDWRGLLFACIAPGGLLGYMAYLGLRFHEPLAFVKAALVWRPRNPGPWMHLWHDLARLSTLSPLAEGWPYQTFLNWGAFALVAGTAWPVYRRLGTGYALFLVLGILVPAWGTSEALSRYTLVLFPLFMMLGYWGRDRRLDRALTSLFCVLLGLTTAAFVNWYWIT